jgi:hypothetical protein
LLICCCVFLRQHVLLHMKFHPYSLLAFSSLFILFFLFDGVAFL